MRSHGLLLPAELEHLLEALAVEQRDREVDPLVGRELPADLEVRLVDLGQPGVDDLLVELLLLLEAEDLRGLLGEHPDDPVEHGVVEIGVVDGDGVDGPVERLAEGDPDLEPVERLGAAVQPDDDRALLRLERVEVPDHQRVDRHLAHEPLGHGAELAVADGAEPEGAHDDEVVVLALHVLDQGLVVLAVHHPRLEREPGRLRLLPHHLEVRVRDQLEAHRDEGVVDLPLALQLVLVPVLLGQRVLHLLEAVVVKPRRVDVAAGQGRAEGSPELHGQVDGAVGVVRVVDRHVDLPEHGGLPWGRRGHVSSNSTTTSLSDEAGARWRPGGISSMRRGPGTGAATLPRILPSLTARPVGAARRHRSGRPGGRAPARSPCCSGTTRAGRGRRTRPRRAPATAGTARATPRAAK